MLSFNSALLSVAGDFCGAYAPYQSVQITPGKSGGVFLASTDKGNVACLAFDAAGNGDESMCVLPSGELIRACKGIKSAERGIKIEGDVALVTTYRKTTSETKEIPVLKSSVSFPPLASAIQDCLNRWSMTPTVSNSSGRYNITYINNALKSLSVFNSSIVLSAFDGGPMRIQGADDNIVILVMPQTAEPIPPCPDWLQRFASNQ